ncbi:hypothetical protein RQP46_010322 [Phenoliferia psychrophenolica]
MLQPATRPLHFLPEIISLIVAELAAISGEATPRNAAILRVALVHKAWSTSALSLLYSDLHLEWRHSKAQPFLTAVQRRPHLLLRVTRLDAFCVRLDQIVKEVFNRHGLDEVSAEAHYRPKWQRYADALDPTEGPPEEFDEWREEKELEDAVYVARRTPEGGWVDSTFAPVTGSDIAFWQLVARLPRLKHLRPRGFWDSTYDSDLIWDALPILAGLESLDVSQDYNGPHCALLANALLRTATGIHTFITSSQHLSYTKCTPSLQLPHLRHLIIMNWRSYDDNHAIARESHTVPDLVLACQTTLESLEFVFDDTIPHEGFYFGGVNFDCIAPVLGQLPLLRHLTLPPSSKSLHSLHFGSPVNEDPTQALLDALPPTIRSLSFNPELPSIILQNHASPILFETWVSGKHDEAVALLVAVAQDRLPLLRVVAFTREVSRGSDLALQFDKKVVIITGGGGGLGKAYATFFASRGAYILINDFSKKAADAVVKEIEDAGGKAIANYDNVAEGSKIVQQAVDKWGTVHILINNAGILRDKSFKAMTDVEWDQIFDVHVKGAYTCTKAAWPLMRKQKFGRIINTASAAGIYGNFGQANYSAAKFALVGFSRTLAREGVKYNILTNAIAPVAASQMTETIMPPEMLANMSPAMIVPLVAYLVHDTTTENGQLFEAGAGWYGKLRWERTKGAVFAANDSFTPAAVKARWDEVNDFTDPEHPESITDANYLEYLEKAKKISSNPQGDQLSFAGKTVLITGAGAGLGRAYALMYAKGGANVVVNDMSKENADAVVAEIKKAGGKAAAAVGSTEDGEKIVKLATDAFGSLHVVVCNAGILRDKSFLALTDAEWQIVVDVHLRGTYSVCHAAWPIFQKQKYGRILTTCSAVGIYGNFGQANYSTAKSGIIGLTKTLGIEGKKYNILANCIAPNAGTAMTRTIWPEEMVKAFSPDFVAPIVGYLTSEENESTSGLFEVSGGWVAAVRWQKTNGYGFPINVKVTPEAVKAKWDVITRFDDKSSNPETTSDSIATIVENFDNQAEASSPWEDAEDSDLVKQAKASQKSEGEYTYTERDVALYNLGIGATEKELPFTFEGDEDFQALPTFGVIPQFTTSSGLGLDWLPNFSPMQLLHGEQWLIIHAPIPTSGTLVSEAVIAEALDKGKAAAVTTVTKTTNQATGELIFENHSTVFIRKAGGFGGKKTGIDRGAGTAANKPPSRKPDAIVEEKTLPIQAALYRLSGDYNPLHIDPNFAAVGGFDQPILHGLCFFGISGKHIFRTFGAIKDIKVRFVGSVYPGETLITEMWKEGNKIIFVTKVKERDAIVLGAAAATLA